MNENNILGVILAGGKSKRFGEDKSLKKLGKYTLLEHTVLKIEKFFSELLIISNNSELKFKQKNIFIIDDYIKGNLGPLVGVLSAMKWIKKNGKKYEWILTFPCDTPYFDRKVISELINEKNKGEHKLFFIKNNDKRHNIFGLWSLNLIDILEKDIKNNYRKVELWADKIGSKIINISENENENFLNINTIEDLQKAEKILKKKHHDFL